MTTEVESTDNTDNYLLGIKSSDVLTCSETDGIDLNDIAVSVLEGTGNINDDQDNNHHDDIDDNDDTEDDEMIYNVNSTDSTVPVGITIAYKRYVAAADAEGRDVETMVPSSTRRNHRTMSGTWNNMSTEKRIKSTPTHSKSKRNQHINSNSSSNNYSKQLRDAKKSKWSVHKSLQVLLDSSLIYILCIIIPPILAYVYHNIIQEISWDSIKSIVANERTGVNNTSEHDSSSSVSYYYHSFIDPWFEYLNEYKSYQYVKSSVYEPTIQYMCTPITNYDTASTSSNSSNSYNYYTSYLWTTVVEQMGICPPEYLRPQLHRSVISDDMSIYMDVFYVTICSFLLAIVRMMIVHYTIFKNSGSRVHDVVTSDHPNNTIAMSNVDALTILVRCKSNHLLSSDYYVVTSTPDHSSHQRRVKELSLDAISQCMVTNLNEVQLCDAPITPNDQNTGMNENDANSSTIDTFGYNIDDSDRDVASSEHPPVDDMDNNSAIIRMNPLAVGIPASASVNHLQSSHAINKDDDNNIDDDGKDMLTLATPQYDTMIQDRRKRDEELDEEEEKQNQQQCEREHRKLVYAAPRYATAIFRLLYCTITAGIALLYFRHADFWPWFVFGTGRGTKQCWDLSGGITVGGMDSDFDQHNAVLKRYFLWQASYHIHSTTFHFLLSMIFLFYPFVSSTTVVDTDNNVKVSSSSSSKRLRGIKRGSHAYIRSFIQHLLSLLLIAVAYIFSSLRRLGAIGLFAFDVSSWSLHLLQICINAPDDSYLWTLLPTKYRNDRESFTRGLYLYVVVPSFVIARFMIWPALWYSAAYESKSWLQQLEMTLWPGSALLLRIIMHSLMLILHGISLLYLRRLLYHRLFSK